MEPVKTAGAREIEKFQRRVRRAHALGRIGKADLMYIDSRVDEILARVAAMTETTKEGEDADGFQI